MEARKAFLFVYNFSAAFDRVSHCGLLCKLRSIGIGGHFLFIVSEFFINRRQSVCLDGKVRVSVIVVSGVTQSSVLGLLLFIWYTSGLFHIVGNHIVD